MVTLDDVVRIGEAIVFVGGWFWRRLLGIRARFLELETRVSKIEEALGLKG